MAITLARSVEMRPEAAGLNKLVARIEECIGRSPCPHTGPTSRQPWERRPRSMLEQTDGRYAKSMSVLSGCVGNEGRVDATTFAGAYFNVWIFECSHGARAHL